MAQPHRPKKIVHLSRNWLASIYAIYITLFALIIILAVVLATSLHDQNWGLQMGILGGVFIGLFSFSMMRVLIRDVQNSPPNPPGSKEQPILVEV